MRPLWTAFAIMAALALTGKVEAQEPRQDDALDSGGGWTVAGTVPERRRIIVAVWALHPFEPSFPEGEWTSGFGFQYRQWFGAAFVNSYGDRSLSGGIERYWVSGRRGVIAGGLGYRLGLITGYDERLFELAKYIPVLPFGGLVGWVDIGPIAWDVFYVYKAISIEGSVRF